jgi:hypothetical protein
MRKFVVLILIAVLFSSGLVNSLPLSQEMNKQFTIPGCTDNPSVDSIEINYPGSGGIPADQVLQFNATVRDNLSQVLSTYPTWGTNNGSIDQNGRFVPWATGSVEIWACAGDINESVTINVLQGTTVGAELLLHSENVTADDLVELMPMRKDERGNLAPVLVPTDNWTIPVGSSLSGASPIYWVPGEKGEQDISVNILGYDVSRTLNVSIGVAHHLQIQTSSTTYNADQEIMLLLSLVDQKGNYWGVSGQWNNDSELPLSNDTGVEVFAYPSEVGIWQVSASYSGNETDGETWFTSVNLSISTGSLTGTEISGFLVDRSGVGVEVGFLEGIVQMTTDDRFIMSPVLLDAEGNSIAVSSVMWSLSADYIEGTELSTNLEYSFAPELVGNHILTLTPDGGIPARITLEVLHGAAVEVIVSNRGNSDLVVPIGRNLSIDVKGIDGKNNHFPMDVSWIIPAHAGNISNGSLGVGNYEYQPGNQTPLKVHTFVVRTALGPHDVPVRVILGQLDHLTIHIDSNLQQGAEVLIGIIGHDENGNPVPIANGDVVLSSSAGATTYRNGEHYLKLEKQGIQHQVTAEYEGIAPSVEFIDIEATLLAGVFGSSEAVLMGAIMFASIILLLVATLTYKKSGERVKSDDEIIAEREAEKEELRNSLTRSGSEINASNEEITGNSLSENTKEYTSLPPVTSPPVITQGLAVHPASMPPPLPPPAPMPFAALPPPVSPPLPPQLNEFSTLPPNAFAAPPPPLLPDAPLLQAPVIDNTAQPAASSTYVQTSINAQDALALLGSSSDEEVQTEAETSTPVAPSSSPPLPAEGLPQGWTMAQWNHYGEEWLKNQS